MLKKVRAPRAPADPSLDALLKEVRVTRPRADTKMIERAYELADRAHGGQMRKSGDPFISHPVAVATILAQLGMDEQAVAAGLLHDAVEDTELSLAEVEE